MKVAVDEDRCRGHGICTTLCPQMFFVNDNGYAEVRSPDVPLEFEESVVDAAEACPERAIDVG